MVPLSRGCGSAVFAAIATLAPSRAARNAIASPMPRLPPDTNSVLPLRDVIEPAPVQSLVVNVLHLSKAKGSAPSLAASGSASIHPHAEFGRAFPAMQTPR